MNIKEVAKAAGVSVATISRVLNHPEQVQPETRNHVLEVMLAFKKSSDTGAKVMIQSTCERPAALPLGLEDGELD